jgi:hypothetical protein
MTMLDKRSHNLSLRLARISPLLAKTVNDGSYLRAMLGTLSLILPLVSAILAIISVVVNASDDISIMITPPWQLLLAMVLIACFDAFSGLVGALVYAIGSLIFAANVPGISDFRLLAGVFVVLLAPSLMATAFRTLRKPPAGDIPTWWERLEDFAIAPFIAGWSAASVVSSLPALAGITLSVANHVADFAFFIAIAVFFRVAFEELAARAFPERLDAINPDELPEPPRFQKAIVMVLKYAIWIFIATALLGNSWQIWVGSALFIVPSILGWFQEKFPNSSLLWKLLPSGIPGLAFSLIIASATTAFAGQIFGASPDFAQWSFAILPLPLLALTVLGAFGRHGKNEHDEKPSQRNVLIYRIGGVLMLLITLRLAGII